MQFDFSFWHLVSEASFMVQIVILMLFGISIFSWVIIFQRIRFFRSLTKIDTQFNQVFWSGKDMQTLHKKFIKQQQDGINNIFCDGFTQFMKLHQCTDITKTSLLSGVERMLKVSILRQSEKLEHGLSWLATIGSVSPYVGLFGTVIGIMHTFSNMGSAAFSIAMIAPGISEALITTALGIGVAIPAVVAYNKFSSTIDKILNKYENFQEEFILILKQQIHTR